VNIVSIRNSAEHRPNAGLAWSSYCRAQYGSGNCTYGRVGARRIGWLHHNPFAGRHAVPGTSSEGVLNGQEVERP